MKAIVEKIVQMLPESFEPFENTEYPMPVSQGIVGQLPDVQRLGRTTGRQ